MVKSQQAPIKISTLPSKHFFTEMLTKDITLVNCVLDLIDNSLHSIVSVEQLDLMGYLLNRKKKPLRRKYKIKIAFDSRRFSIADNCQGIPIKVATEHVFRLGHHSEVSREAGLGVYGIGMKRAFFKIGRRVEVKSNTASEWFHLIFDVDAWRQNEEEWDITLPPQSFGSRGTTNTGLEICITSMHPEIRQLLSTTPFEQKLLEKISIVYCLFLEQGIEITVNGRRAKSAMPIFQREKDLLEQNIERFDNGDVKVLIITGLAPQDDENRGWYVFCNGRLVLDADRSEKTGWGVPGLLPQFHSKFNHFLGVTFFQSKKLEALPWSTTKSNVNLEAPVYQAALTRMAILGRPVVRFFERKYPGKEIPAPLERSIHREGKAVSLTDIPLKKDSQFKAVAKKATKQPELISIKYDRLRSEVEKVKKALGDASMSNKEVGEKTFEYFLASEC